MSNLFSGADGQRQSGADNRGMTDKEAAAIEPWAMVIGVGTMLVVAGVAAFTAWDRLHVAQEEEIMTPTAVGDMHFVKAPASGAGPIGLLYQGKMLDMVSESKVRDSRMVRVGADDNGNYTIYGEDDEASKGRKGALFMKVGVNEFMAVKQE